MAAKITVPPANILFVGNSLTFWNNGIEYHLEQLAGSDNPPLAIAADSVVKGGATLKIMWENTRARDTVSNGLYDVVVLQEDIPETDVESFHKYVRKFSKRITEAGAKLVLFMTWPYERLDWISMSEIAHAHWEIAKELGIKVAPVGLAWEKAKEIRPDLDMYDSDREHPSIYGTYLGVCVIYSTIFEKSPIGLPYLPAEGGVNKDEAALLQNLAWEVIQENQSRT